MGILKLMDFLRAKAPRSIVQISPKELSGKTIAVDASSVIYQFLIQTQIISRSTLRMPTDMKGNKTGHLVGIMSRVSLCQENNIKSIWVFDGKPPPQKSKVKKEAAQKAEEALIEGDLAEALKQQKRTMRITQIQKQFAIKMLNLMGLPTIEAPSESQSQCAYLSQKGLVDAVATEDMDCLPLGSKLMLKTFSRQKVIQSINLEIILEDLKLTREQFIDFCILCGCDYTGRISNVGPVRAFDLIRRHQSIEAILASIMKPGNQRYRIETEFDYQNSRRLFSQPEVTKFQQPFNWQSPDKTNLKLFLAELDFSANRVTNWLERAQKLQSQS